MTILTAAIYQPVADDLSPVQRLERLDDRLSCIDGAVSDIVLCPELFLSGYDVGPKILAYAEPADGTSLKRASEIARKYRTALAIGYPEQDGDVLYNAVAVIGKSGERLLDYRKRVLPPGFEGDTFTPGNVPGIFELAGHRVAVLICYDVEFPEFVREAANAGANLVLAPTALKSKWTFVARKMIPTRAFENGVFLMYANHAGREGESEYLGESVIVGPDGAEMAIAGSGEDFITADLDMENVTVARETLPYLQTVSNRIKCP